LRPFTVYADDDIAKRALIVLDLNIMVPNGALQVKVQDGWLTLTGEVEWAFERIAALNDLSNLRGVVGITNNVTLRLRDTAGNVTQKIEEAFRRNARIDPRDIHVSVHNGKVRLDGQVETWADRQTLQDAAWSAAGVRAVDDHVRVG
jgi:osmotically-inducible protein OsmY